MKNNTASRIIIWVLLLFGVATLGLIIYISSALIADMSRKEAASAQLLMRTTNLISGTKDPSLSDIYSLAGDIIAGNDYLPVILVSHDSVFSTRNLSKPDSLLSYAEKLAALEDLRANGDSSIVDLGNEKQTVYYGQSTILGQLGYIRWLQVLCVALFVVVVYMVANHMRHKERNGIWKGLALETAHQLGTPITALGAWQDLLSTGFSDTSLVAKEMGKDIDRLKSVSERFSHIGSSINLIETGLSSDINTVVDYLRSRVSKKVSIEVKTPNGDVSAPHDATLVQWAVENLCKNAADAIEGAGSITITLSSADGFAQIDVADTGRGMDLKTKRQVFDAGFSTKSRGWGIGLALVHRIVCEYHHGKVFVASSQQNVGTVFRILLPNSSK